SRIFRCWRARERARWREAIVDTDAAAFLPAELLKCLSERRQSRLRLRVIFGVADEHSDPANLCRPDARAPRAATPLPRRRVRPAIPPPSDGDCHTPLPCEVRKGNDTTPRACCPNSAASSAGGARAGDRLRRSTNRSQNAGTNLRLELQQAASRIARLHDAQKMFGA